MAGRKQTNKLLQWLEDGVVEKDFIINACLDYMSEDDVHAMMLANDLLLDIEEEE